MGSFSMWHWIIVLVVVIIIFGGRGKISAIMADVARGFKSFKKELNSDTIKDNSVKKQDAQKKSTKRK
jgi:sec-independent protein translocase protein TatA